MTKSLIRAGIRMILTSAEDIDVVAEAGNGAELRSRFTAGCTKSA